MSENLTPWPLPSRCMDCDFCGDFGGSLAACVHPALGDNLRDTYTREPPPHWCPIASANKPQPPPKANAGTPIWEMVIADMQERNRIGIAKYGTPLQAFNGRKALVDAYQEVLDLAVYLKQKLVEEEQA